VGPLQRLGPEAVGRGPAPQCNRHTEPSHSRYCTLNCNQLSSRNLNSIRGGDGADSRPRPGFLQPARRRWPRAIRRLQIFHSSSSPIIRLEMSIAHLATSASKSAARHRWSCEQPAQFRARHPAAQCLLTRQFEPSLITAERPRVTDHASAVELPPCQFSPCAAERFQATTFLQFTHPAGPP
jgi:hypothetical protein